MIANGTVRTTPAAGEVLPPRHIVQRGATFQSDWLHASNLTSQVCPGSGAFDAILRVSMLDVLAAKQRYAVQRNGTNDAVDPPLTYGQVTACQPPRVVRRQQGSNFQNTPSRDVS